MINGSLAFYQVRQAQAGPRVEGWPFNTQKRKHMKRDPLKHVTDDAINRILALPKIVELIGGPGDGTKIDIPITCWQMAIEFPDVSGSHVYSRRGCNFKYDGMNDEKS
jgi:hypothetical protein